MKRTSVAVVAATLVASSASAFHIPGPRDGQLQERAIIDGMVKSSDLYKRGIVQVNQLNSSYGASHGTPRVRTRARFRNSLMKPLLQTMSSPAVVSPVSCSPLA